MKSVAEQPITAWPKGASFRRMRWSAGALLVGLGFLAIWKLAPVASAAAKEAVAPWLWLVLAGIVPQIFMLCYPLWIRGRAGECETPDRQVRCLVEFCLAVPIVVGTVAAMLIFNGLLVRWFPSAELPDVFGNMEAHQGRAMTMFMLVFAFTFAPAAEELFFRGFLYNAFRERLPLAIAIVVESLIFGFSHFFGFAHALGAFVLGLVLTLVYEWRKTLLAPIFVHAGINFSAAAFAALLMLAQANSASLGISGDPVDARCIVRTMSPGGAAEAAGLAPGDVITAIDGEPIESFANLKEFTRRHRPGDQIRITIERAETQQEVRAVLQRRG